MVDSERLIEVAGGVASQYSVLRNSLKHIMLARKLGQGELLPDIGANHTPALRSINEAEGLAEIENIDVLCWITAADWVTVLIAAGAYEASVAVWVW